MNNFFIENDRNIQSGLCLISAFRDCDYIGFTNINFLNEDSTIQEYKDWELETINTVITLSDYKQAPQKFRHEKICRVENIPYIAKVTFEENDYDLKEEEILNPFWGGLREVN